jgi:hypothetical protein
LGISGTSNLQVVTLKCAWTRSSLEPFPNLSILFLPTCPWFSSNGTQWLFNKTRLSAMAAAQTPRPRSSISTVKSNCSRLQRPLFQLIDVVVDPTTMLAEIGAIAHPSHVVESFLLKPKERACFSNSQKRISVCFVHLISPLIVTEVSRGESGSWATEQFPHFPGTARERILRTFCGQALFWQCKIAVN